MPLCVTPQAPLENTPIPMWVPDGAGYGRREGRQHARRRRPLRLRRTASPGRSRSATPPTPAAFNTAAAAHRRGHRLVRRRWWLVRAIGRHHSGQADVWCTSPADGRRDPRFSYPGDAARSQRRSRSRAAGCSWPAVTLSAPTAPDPTHVALDPATGAMLSWMPASTSVGCHGLVAGGGVVYVTVARRHGLRAPAGVRRGHRGGVPFTVLQDAEVAAVTGGRVYVRAATPSGPTISAYTAAGQLEPAFAPTPARRSRGSWRRRATSTSRALAVVQRRHRPRWLRSAPTRVASRGRRRASLPSM